MSELVHGFSDATPLAYAKSIAYLRCPKKIRNRTELYFGHAPSLKEIERILAPKRARLPAAEPLESDGQVFAVKGTVKAPKKRIAPAKAPERFVPVEAKPPIYWQGLNVAVAKELMVAVARAFDADYEALCSPSRQGKLVAARAVFVRILRERGNSYPQIARRLKRDHSTVIHMHRTFDIRVKLHPEMLSVYETIKGLGG